MEDRYTHIISGVCGALAAALLSHDLNWRKLAVTMVTGSGFSVFVVPYACAQFGLQSPQALSAAGFLGGVLGCTILGKLLQWVQERNWIDLLVERFTKK